MNPTKFINRRTINQNSKNSEFFSNKSKSKPVFEFLSSTPKINHSQNFKFKKIISAASSNTNTNPMMKSQQIHSRVNEKEYSDLKNLIKKSVNGIKDLLNLDEIKSSFDLSNLEEKQKKNSQSLNRKELPLNAFCQNENHTSNVTVNINNFINVPDKNEIGRNERFTEPDFNENNNIKPILKSKDSDEDSMHSKKEIKKRRSKSINRADDLKGLQKPKESKESKQNSQPTKTSQNNFIDLLSYKNNQKETNTAIKENSSMPYINSIKCKTINDKKIFLENYYQPNTKGNKCLETPIQNKKITNKVQFKENKSSLNSNTALNKKYFSKQQPEVNTTQSQTIQSTATNSNTASNTKNNITVNRKYTKFQNVKAQLKYNLSKHINQNDSLISTENTLYSNINNNKSFISNATNSTKPTLKSSASQEPILNTNSSSTHFSSLIKKDISLNIKGTPSRFTTDNTIINTAGNINTVNNTLNEEDKVRSSSGEEKRENNFQRKTLINQMSPLNKDSPLKKSFANYHEIINKIYNKDFPHDIPTNDILKLLLFLNEYVMTNGLLKDIHIEKNKEILNAYSKLLCQNINIDYPEEEELDYLTLDKLVYCTTLIQRKWRQYKIISFLGKKKKNKINEELKKMIVQDCIKKNWLKVKKITGLFNSMTENFRNISNEPFVNETFHYIDKLTKGTIPKGELNSIYKRYINKVIFRNENFE
ncbi:MAG: hypothetical protein MJ252_18355 [archaeon]|nr:hypothetical protein [archaeon]